MTKLILTTVLVSSLLTPLAVYSGRGMNYCWFDQWLFWALGGGGTLHCTGDEY